VSSAALAFRAHRRPCTAASIAAVWSEGGTQQLLKVFSVGRRAGLLDRRWGSSTGGYEAAEGEGGGNGGGEEEDAAPPTGCWIWLPRLGGGCMSSGSKVDSSTSGARGTRSRGKMLPRSSSTSRLLFPRLLPCAPAAANACLHV
jgi:hypothetical protein